MALLKQCLNCSNKGIFLKLNDGICPSCLQKLNDLENLYTSILQKVAINNNYDVNTISALNKLLIDLSTFNNTFANHLKFRCNDLLNSLNTKPQKENNLINNPSSIKIKNVLEPCPIIIKATTPTNISKSISLDFKSIIPTSEVQENKNIKIINKPVFNTDNSLETASSNKINDVKNINLNLSAISTDNFVKTQSEATTLNASTLTFSYDSLQQKCDLLSSNLKDLNTPTNLIAEIYFNIKSEFNSILQTSNDLNANALKILDEAKTALCVRTNKDENELFSFFNYVSISIQTTGANPATCNIIEMSAFKISYGEVLDKFYTLVNPIKSIKSTITATTGISNSDVISAPTIDIALDKLIEFIGSFELLSYGSKFVDSFLNFNFNKLKNKDLNIKNTCTMTLYKSRYKNYHGEIAKQSNITICCHDLLSKNELDYINSFPSISTSNAYATYKLFEILKYRYK